MTLVPNKRYIVELNQHWDRTKPDWKRTQPQCVYLRMDGTVARVWYDAGKILHFFPFRLKEVE